MDVFDGARTVEDESATDRRPLGTGRICTRPTDEWPATGRFPTCHQQVIVWPMLALLSLPTRGERIVVAGKRWTGLPAPSHRLRIDINAMAIFVNIAECLKLKVDETLSRSVWMLWFIPRIVASNGMRVG
jgi:hypothetical protein